MIWRRDLAFSMFMSMTGNWDRLTRRSILWLYAAVFMTHVDDLPLHTSHCGATFCKISPQFCKHEGVGGSWSLAGRRSKSCFAQMKYVMINNYAAKHSQKALHPLSCFLKCLAKRALCTVRLVTAAGLWSFSLSAISGETLDDDF